MEIKENKITMDLVDFEELVNKQVEIALSQNKKRYTAQNVFMSVAIKGNDIKQINMTSPLVINWIDKCNAYSGAVYTKNMFNTSGYGSTYKVSDTGVHTLLRKLATSVLGHGNNGEIRYDEFEMAIEYYAQFKELWLSLYAERLRIEGEKFFLSDLSSHE
ncbi:hypothetical protein BAU15_05260 [Enterococcus sp. JM4C]|uniref:hypothetical protein n=1 Tax=Candidatus Enterococcus huntleyi TaxID=1857217 RepID=UPI00137B40A0|nr:hypothetical protein [Enterococcus sp. JM4C]KAF1295161.1 hypothetical protein BAU15_05260 [Enterococcus sp. JM4C]